MTDEQAQQFGFADSEEFFRLITAVDLTRPGAIEQFKAWKADYGTKKTLLLTFPECYPVAS